MRPFRKLQKRLGYLKKKQVNRIYEAFLTAHEAHAGQKRSSGEAYITHPLTVACLLADMHMDAESIMAAILHDIIEDTDLSKETVTEKFGKNVAQIVDGVTKLSKIQFSSTAEAQAESFRKMIMAMSQDIRVILIKLADRLHNMRTINSLPEYKRHRIAKETLDIYAPIANRLGMRDIYMELENLSFATLHPLRYEILTTALKKARGNRKEIMSVIEKALHKHFNHSALPKAQIIGREKHIYSIYKKMVKKHLSFSEIMDVYAFRIVVADFDDCYRAVGIVHSLYKPMPGRFKDYIAIPKINGYQSLHTTLFGPHGVPLEIQIRTEEMDQIATKGIAAHWLYKTKERLDESHIRAQQWINKLLELQQQTGNSLEFIENVKIDLFPDQIYVFTPKGGIIELPRGSSPVDFAYAIHTDIGNSCVSARIDRQFAPLSTELHTGQTVAVITAPGAHPNPSWLNFVKTAKARSGIRHYLRNQTHTDLVTLGKQLLTKAFHDLSLEPEQVPKKAYNTVVTEAKLTDLDALYEDIAIGNRIAVFVAHQLISASKQKQLLKDAVAKEEQPLLINGTEGIAVQLASCCSPVPGDAIVGYLIPGHGLMIHRDNCININKLRKHPERCVLVRWSDEVKGEFPAKISVEMSSRRGSFASLTKALSDAEANIEDITIKERTGEHYATVLTIYVRNKDHLNKVLRSLANLKTVAKVTRI